jgi:hypothetical protein
MHDLRSTSFHLIARGATIALRHRSEDPADHDNEGGEPPQDADTMVPGNG